MNTIPSRNTQYLVNQKLLGNEYYSFQNLVDALSLGILLEFNGCINSHLTPSLI
jgi:hypothetical protein